MGHHNQIHHPLIHKKYEPAPIRKSVGAATRTARTIRRQRLMDAPDREKLAEKGIASCKLQMANCKLRNESAEIPSGGNWPDGKFAICNLQFAICNGFSFGVSCL